MGSFETLFSCVLYTQGRVTITPGHQSQPKARWISTVCFKIRLTGSLKNTANWSLHIITMPIRRAYPILKVWSWTEMKTITFGNTFEQILYSIHPQPPESFNVSKNEEVLFKFKHWSEFQSAIFASTIVSSAHHAKLLPW